jgi:hypothetical protein
MTVHVVYIHVQQLYCSAENIFVIIIFLLTCSTVSVGEGALVLCSF